MGKNEGLRERGEGERMRNGQYEGGVCGYKDMSEKGEGEKGKQKQYKSIKRNKGEESYLPNNNADNTENTAISHLIIRP